MGEARAVGGVNAHGAEAFSFNGGDVRGDGAGVLALPTGGVGGVGEAPLVARWGNGGVTTAAGAG